MIRAALVPLSQAFEVSRSRSHGAPCSAWALKPSSPASRVESAISCWRWRPRGLLRPRSKLATTRRWQTTTLAEDCAVEDASENDLYAAMDWLLHCQSRIEKKLAKRHLQPAAVSVHAGNTGDCETFLPEVQRLRQDFGIEQLVIVGDP
jgi:hypothetical protein